ncbi:hypothetical protein T12_5557 [Trichinella patagoniensis]|uniref:Uncharacterized protein n=1 Tax=Trichinella patagoniensis TaxID=990121 RepID=A0A0V0YVJ3_9BILA|nr:hypothetical protein T12_5557 [Trichinella patagoniensis]
MKGGRLVVSLGAIEPSMMPWGLPEVVTQKKDGSPFLRRLSQTERRDADPRIDDTLNALPRAVVQHT